MSSQRLPLAVAAALLLAFPVRSATIRVPSDYPTIQEGVDGAAAGDTVLVAPGTYYGSPGSANCVVLDKGITLTSEGGAAVTTIDGEGTRRVVSSTTSQPRTIQGFTITRGFADKGAGLYVGSQGVSMIQDNIFEANSATSQGGGIYCSEIGGDKYVDSNLFVHNSANSDAACHFAHGGMLEFSANAVLNNVTTNYYPAIYVGVAYGSLNMTDCVVANNGGGLSVTGECSDPVNIRRCTFAQTGVPIESNFSEYIVIEQTIIVGSIYQHYLDTCETNFQLNYVDLYGGAFYGYLEYVTITWNQPNLNADPLFCDPLNGDFSLAAGSACLPQNNAWGLQIGAFGQGCDPVSLTPDTWARIKARYR
jgi:hypothetical protein